MFALHRRAGGGGEGGEGARHRERESDCSSVAVPLLPLSLLGRG